MDLTWKIIQNSADPNLGLKVLGLDSDSDFAWSYFFSGFSLAEYPKLLEAVATEVGLHVNGTGVNFPLGLSQADPSTLQLASTDVRLYVPGFEDSVLPRATFYTILSAFAERLLERYDQSSAWHESMRVALAKLRAKMATDAAVTA